MDERVNPLILTDPVDGAVYELDFNRDSVLFAENREFKIDEMFDYPAKNVPLLFWYALRKNHKSVAKNQAETILLDHFKGLSVKKIGTLVALYNQARFANAVILDDDEDEDEGNGKNV